MILGIRLTADECTSLFRIDGLVVEQRILVMVVATKIATRQVQR